MFKMSLLCSFKGRDMLRAKSQDTLIIISESAFSSPRDASPQFRISAPDVLSCIVRKAIIVRTVSIVALYEGWRLPEPYYGRRLNE
jgi:hypothetical protein